MHTYLTELKNYRKWVPFEKKLQLISVEKKEDFFQNECAPWAPDGDIQWGANMFVLNQARKSGAKVLIADDSHFAHPEERVVQDVRLAQQGDWKFWGSYHRQSSEEAWEYFRDRMKVQLPTFESWVENTHDWASRFKDFKFDSTPNLPTKFYPSDSLAFTKELIKRHGRMQALPEKLARLKSEIDVLHRNGRIDLLPYFQIDEEVCRFYERQGWLAGPGRGSAAGLLLCNLLGITHADPLRFGLSQDRFITPDRINGGKMPDIDQDLPFREPLVGQATDVIEVEMEDGTLHVLPEYLKVETEQGDMTIREALACDADIKPWWLDKEKP
jgi:DNA polymerase III alpha subunit